MGRVVRVLPLLFVCALGGAGGCGDKVKPIDRDVPTRRSGDASTRSVKDAAPPLVKGDEPIIEVDDAGRVLLDGAAAGDTALIREQNRMQKIDELYSRLKDRREAWKTSHPGGAFPGVVGLRVGPATPAVVLKSAFQTAAFAGYPNITIQVRGAPDMFDADAQVPGPPDPTLPPAVPEKVMFVTVGVDGAEIAWKRGVEVLSTASLRPEDVARGICDEWLKNGAHVDPTDPRIDQMILRVDNAFTAADVAPYLAAIKSCIRKMPDGTEGRALGMTFSVR